MTWDECKKTLGNYGRKKWDGYGVCLMKGENGLILSAFHVRGGLWECRPITSEDRRANDWHRVEYNDSRCRYVAEGNS